jgi:signal transduction histidine kinase
VKSDIQNTGKDRLPWWTWVVPFVVLHLGSQVAIMTRYDQGVADYYLPTAISVILVNIWGPWRTIPAAYINATLSTYLWDVENALLWPVYAFPETLMVFLSWYWFTYRLKGKYWLPNIRNLLLFLVFGLSLPILIEIALLESVQVYFGEHDISDALPYFTRNILSEFIANFGLTLPVLTFVTPWLQRRHLLYITPPTLLPMPGPARRQVIEVGVVFAVLTALTYLIPFERFWFIYGILSLYIALRHGFGGAIITNLYILLITYIIPTLAEGGGPASMDVIYIFLGTSMLFVFAAITGRVISDLRITEKQLYLQNAQLELANKELDHFVYSVSHDLSAPLKSILGLVAVNRLATTHEEKSETVNKIETSVVKLESLIREILDYSYNKRLQLKVEPICLKTLCSEILDSLAFMEGYHNIKILMETDGVSEVYNDRTRLKLILNNLLANAILFQRKAPGHEPYVRISARRENEFVLISVEDNGEGIKPGLQNKIFNMFFRGTITSKGSGLGLYIAREAAEKISSRIFVKSEYGKGSVFTLAVRNLEEEAAQS